MFDERGQSNPLGIAIILVLALTSALLITGVGGVTLDEGRQVAETQSGIRTMTELDSRASLVALDGADSATIDVNKRAGDGRVSTNQSGEIRFVFQNKSNGTIWQENFTLGTVTYANGDTRIAYQGGGVWRRTEGTNGSVMVSPPEVNYRGETLTLPIIQVNGTDRGISTASIRKTNETPIYPIPSKGANYSNPVPTDRELVIYVQSDYYRAWGEFFRTRIGGNVTVFPGNRTVRVDLTSPSDKFKVDSGLISVGAGGAEIFMKGTGSSPTFVDSYNSDINSYPGSKTNNGTVTGPSGLSLNGNSYLNGTLDTGGPVTVKSQSIIRGDAYYQGSLTLQGNGNVTGEVNDTGEGPDIDPIDETVNESVNEICANGEELPDTGTTINASGNSTYCYDGDLDYNGETLTIDLQDGNVSVAVTGDVELKSSTIKVINASNSTNKKAELWVGGDEVKIVSGSQVTVNDDISPAFRLYGTSTLTTKIKGTGTEFVGLLYAPSRNGAGGGLVMQSSSLYGAAVTGTVDMTAGSSVHYDQALDGFQFDRSGVPPDQLSYLYVTVHEVKIEQR